MRKDDWSIVILWAVLLIVVCVAVWSGLLNEAVRALGTVLAATISGAVVLLGAILTHTLTELREQRLLHQREMQRNYTAVLGRISEVIRESGGSDEFSQVHLESWVLGSSEVIKATQDLLKAKTPEDRRLALESLVLAMRKDVGLPEAAGLKLEHVFGRREEGHVE